MFSNIKEKVGGAAIGALVASLAVAGALAMPATAQQATGGPVASASHGMVQHVKRALQIGRVANRRSVQAIRTARAAHQVASQPGPQGPTGPQGPPGADGDDLSDGAVTTEKLADGAVTASKFGSTVRRSNSESVPSETSRVIAAECNPGEVRLSGGGTWLVKFGFPPQFPPSDILHIHRSFPQANDEAWSVGVYNGDNSEAWTFAAYVLCLQL